MPNTHEISMELVVPPEVADDLIHEGLANSADSRSLLLPGGDELATVLQLAYATATVVTLTVDTPEAVRAIARRLAFWRRHVPDPPAHRPYTLSMEGPSGYVEFGLDNPPDLDALTAFLAAVYGIDEG